LLAPHELPSLRRGTARKSNDSFSKDFLRKMAKSKFPKKLKKISFVLDANGYISHL